MLDTATKTRLNDLDDPAGCAAFAKSHLMQLERHTCSPPADLVRILQVIAQVPARSVILKERFEFVQEGARGHDKTKRQTVRWRNSGIRLQPQVPANLNNGKARRTKIPLPLLQYCLMHAVHEEVRDCLSGDAHPAQPHRRSFIDFYSGCRSAEQRRYEPFQTSCEWQTSSGPYRPCQCFRLLALIELVDTPFWKLPHDHNRLLSMVLAQRQQESCDCEVVSEMLEAAVQRLIAYGADPTWSYAQAQFLKLKGTAIDRQRQLRDMVQKLAEAFQKENVDPAAFKPNHFAALSAYHAIFLRKGDTRPRNGLNRWCFGLRGYVAGECIEAEEGKQEHLASQCLPRHSDASGAAQPAGQNMPGRAIASAPVTCELCHVGLAGHDKLLSHCHRKHGGFVEYRKRVFYKAREAGHCELQPWVKRNMVQAFQFFRLHSVPSSCNDYTLKATKEAVPRREEACAVCAVRDWLENRYPVRLFSAASGTTTWKKFFFAVGEDANEDEEDDDHNSLASGGPHPARCTLLIDGESNFCVGSKEKVLALLDVERYILQWPLIPIAELHASSVQHPDDPNMRWLLHSRRVACLTSDDVPHIA